MGKQWKQWLTLFFWAPRLFICSLQMVTAAMKLKDTYFLEGNYAGGLLEWWYDPGVPLAFPVESASS